MQIISVKISAVVLIFVGCKESAHDLKKYHVTGRLREATPVPSNMLPTNYWCCEQKLDAMVTPIVSNASPYDAKTFSPFTQSTEKTLTELQELACAIYLISHSFICFTALTVKPKTIVFTPSSLQKNFSCVRSACSINHS